MDHYSLRIVLTEIAEWRSLKPIITNHVDVTKSKIDVSLLALAGIHAWFVRELLERGQLEFRMGGDLWEWCFLAHGASTWRYVAA
jgi:hypothetical protein